MSLVDGFGRQHTNLRLSVTDRCNLRCTYCMAEDTRFFPAAQLLTFAEMVQLVHLLVALGIRKLRLTGGEPLLRPKLPELVQQLRQIAGVTEISLTTNGMLLSDQADALRAAGVDRLNLSLDTISPEWFQRLTRRDGLAAVLRGLRAAQAAGFNPIKLNALATTQLPAAELVRLAQFARSEGCELRFIEYMPLEADRDWQPHQVRSAAEIRQLLAAAGLPVRPVLRTDPHAPAEDFEYIDGKGRIGLVASVTQPFCGQCNRLRLTADGKLRNCLFALQDWNLRDPLRAGATAEELTQLIQECVAAKWAGHQIGTLHFIRPARTMHTIGG